MATTAFLILAHHEPELLARLLGRLDHPQAVAFVHVDRKVDQVPLKAAAGGRASFLPDGSRVAVHWRGFSMTRATLNLIRAALSAEPDLKRFVLLSGVDYPVRPISEILAAVGEDLERIRVDRALDPAGEGWFDRCASRVFLGDNALLNPRTGRHRVARLARALEARTRRRPYGETIYYGPQWWALTRAAIDIVLAADREDRRKIVWFRYACTPDEMVFQTLLRNSERASNIEQDATRGPITWHAYRVGLHYVDFDNPNPDAPRTLTLSDLESIRASGALFARKMDLMRSAELMSALDSAAAVAV
jgi:Core-2/I-Branching enzyme